MIGIGAKVWGVEGYLASSKGFATDTRTASPREGRLATAKAMIGTGAKVWGVEGYLASSKGFATDTTTASPREGRLEVILEVISETS